MSKSSDMVLTASSLLALSTLIALYLPPLLSPLPFSGFPTDSHNLLHLSQNISLPSGFGPESLAFDPSGVGPYTGVADGTILKWDSSSSSWLLFAFTSSSRKECTRPFAPELEHICGRPLGLKFEQKSGDLYIADAYLGLHRVGSEGGLASLVVDEAEGEPLYFTNDMDIDEDEDIIYFTDSSTKLRRRHFMHSILSGDKTGRFIKYNKLTKQTTVLVRDLAFANGVALSQDRSFVLVAETRACRILRYWLKGPNAGRLDTFIELPGYPDNVRRNQNGEFWVAIHAKKTVLADWMLRNVWFKNVLIKVPPSVVQKLHALFVGGHHAIAVKLNEQGQVIEVLEDAQGKKVRYASEVDERNGKLWIGSVMMPSIWVYNLDQ